MKKAIICLLVIINIFSIKTLYSEEDITVGSFNDSEIKVGIQSGTIQEGIADKMIPNAEKIYFDDYSSIYMALSDGKIDCYITPAAIYRQIADTYPQFIPCEEKLPGTEIAYGLSKDPSKDRLYEELCSFISQNRELIDDRLSQWKNNFDEVERPKYHELSSENGVLKVIVSATAEPYIYYENNEITGFEVDLLTHFADEYGYGLEFEDCPFDSIILAIKQDKADIASACLAATEERKQSIRFSTPYLSEYNILVYSEAITKGASIGFFDNFYKSFIREDRYKLMINGLITTLVITITSAILATILAAIICFLKIRGNKTINKICDAYIQVFEGTPILVLLLVFYYVIFSDRSASAMFVSIIVCALNSAAFFAESLYAGIKNVDPGQKEAGLALGYNEFQTFTKFILPCAAQTFLPTYQSSIISLLKGTSVVSYISVQDLTKAAEIIRTRTYEPLLPLVSVAIIYFLLSRLITYSFKKLQESLKPQRCGKYLKGVKLHDKD